MPFISLNEILKYSFGSNEVSSAYNAISSSLLIFSSSFWGVITVIPPTSAEYNEPTSTCKPLGP